MQPPATPRDLYHTLPALAPDSTFFSAPFSPWPLRSFLLALPLSLTSKCQFSVFGSVVINVAWLTRISWGLQRHAWAWAVQPTDTILWVSHQPGQEGFSKAPASVGDHHSRATSIKIS